MSWQPCGDADRYSLAVPAALRLFVASLHIGVAFSILTLSIPADLAVLIGLIVWRSWCLVRNQQAAVSDKSLWVDRQGRIRLDTTTRSQSQRVVEPASKAQGGRVQCGPPRSGAGGESTALTPWASAGESYTVCRSLRMPGCLCLRLVDTYGKRLEILVFYRYDQREFYQRLWRFLALP